MITSPLNVVIVLTIITSIPVCVAHLNLYMNASETRRLIGINGELFYVRNGIINDYALSFVLPIKPDTIDIYFDWQSLRRSPLDPIMYYHLSITTSNPEAIRQPTASIALDGQVPPQPSVFSIHLPCTGEVIGDVEIKISIDVSLFSTSNVTNLELRRRKTCLKDDLYKNIQNIDLNGDLMFIDHLVREKGSSSSRIADKSSPSSSHMFYIGVGCACGAIVVVALTILVCYVRSHKRAIEHFSDASSAAMHENMYQRADTPNRSIVSGATSMTSRRGPTPVKFTELKPTDVHTAMREIAIDRNEVAFGSALLEGTFGRVYLGTLLADSSEDLLDKRVLIKTVTDEARPDQVDMMIREGSLMLGLKHPNINSVYACCFEPHQLAPLLIYPFLDEGNLKKFLLRCRISDVGLNQTLNTQQLVYMAIQITRAIQYLHRRHILHCDIATRNCLVDSHLKVQLADTALSRDLFPRDYHCLGDNENRPIKWMAIESLVDRKFSPASEMWSFGVTLWEIMTLGMEPYCDIDPFEMASYLKQGYRVTQPVNCPNELFAIMACCWATCPDERPKFGQLQLCLQDFYTALGRYV